jgi:hypothetical protein
MKLFLVVVTLAIAAGCSQRASKIEAGAAGGIADELTYVKDSRTQLCFAVVASRHVMDVKQNGFTITWVPCTPAVEAQLRR